MFVSNWSPDCRLADLCIKAMASTPRTGTRGTCEAAGDKSGEVSPAITHNDTPSPVDQHNTSSEQFIDLIDPLLLGPDGAGLSA